MYDIDFKKTAGLAKSKSQPNENSFQTLQKFLAQFAFMAKTYVQKKKNDNKNAAHLQNKNSQFEIIRV